MIDLVIVGGGLLGAGAARDAAGRGLSVCLFEQADFGAGATGRGGPLIAGGLGALETLDFARVREQIREREILLQTAPGLVAARRCLVPFYGHGLLAQARPRASLALADALGFQPSHPLHPPHSPHQLISAAEARERAPALRPDGLTGAALVWEADTPRPARLALALALDARASGAALRPRTRVDSLRWARGAGGRGSCAGVRWTDTLTGETGETPAALTLLAAGAWLSGLGAAPDALPPPVARVSALGTPLEGAGDALVFPRGDERGPLLAVPGPDGAWLGGCESPLAGGPDARFAARADVAPLARALAEFLPAVRPDALRAAWAAPAAPPPPPPSAFGAAAPAYGLWDHAGGAEPRAGLLSLWGGGPASFRAAAEEAVDLACRKLGRSLSAPPCRTATQPLPAPDALAWDASFDARDADGSAARIARVAAGTECRTLADFLLRRLSGPPPAGDDPRLAVVLAALSAHFGWDDARRARERKAYEAEVALAQAFRVL